MKLHIGCGTVLLRDYLNIDCPGPTTFLATERPDLVAKWQTDESDYYGRHQDKTLEALREGPMTQEYVCDRYGSFAFLPVRSGEVTEVLSRHAFEHLGSEAARTALDLLRMTMVSGAILRLDVPDSEATLDLYRTTGDDFYKRHLLGPRRDDHGYHLPYTRESLRLLVEQYGFTFQYEEDNIHWHPSFCLRFYRR